MFDSNEDVRAFHRDEVNLPTRERDAMRDRRDANRKRLRAGLERDGKPNVKDFHKQGSYAMRTMTRQPDKDYDIDDGVYFQKADLVGPQGGNYSALDARKMVRDALDDSPDRKSKTFKSPPEVRANCVRVHYDAGYHVDIPVYRWVEKDGERVAELASADWKRSDARDVTAWFDGENKRQSSDYENGGQLRRITRDLKKFATTRSSWKGRNLSGFGITKLVTERYSANVEREDRALRDTMRAIRDRLNVSLVIQHPVTPGDVITNGADDPRARCFRDKLTKVLARLAVLDHPECTEEDAAKAWDFVFNTRYFTDRVKSRKEQAVESDQTPSAAAGTAALLGAVAAATAGILTSRKSGAEQTPDRPIEKKGGDRYA